MSKKTALPTLYVACSSITVLAISLLSIMFYAASKITPWLYIPTSALSFVVVTALIGMFKQLRDEL
jgi:hypothetical protein